MDKDQMDMASVFGTEGRGFEPPGAAGRTPGTLMYYVNRAECRAQGLSAEAPGFESQGRGTGAECTGHRG